MKFIALGRQEGKTHLLLDWMLAKPFGERALVVIDSREAQRVATQLSQRSLYSREEWSRYVIPPQSNRLRGTNIEELGFDNLDTILASIYCIKPAIATITKEQG